MKPAALSLLTALALLAGAAPAAEPPDRLDRPDREACLACHETIAAANPESPHRRSPVRCASCHGDGARHAETGDPNAIRSFKGQPAAAVCVSCHQGPHIDEWKASRHHQVGVDCIDCHAIHAAKQAQESCRGCH